MSLDPNTRARIESLLQAHPVLLFMKGEPNAPQCGFSAKAVTALREVGTPFGHVDVLSDPEIREGIKAFGDWPTIPQLYIHGELVGGSDIIEQMTNSGELHGVLGLPVPDRTPPSITITPAAAKIIAESLQSAGNGYALQIDVDSNYQSRLQLAPADPAAIAATSEGVRAQFSLASAQRAKGLVIDWVDDERGRGLVIENPNAPQPVQSLSVTDAAAQLEAGEITVIDVRPADERELARLNQPFLTFDDGMDPLLDLPKDTRLAFLCHTGRRSLQAAEQFRARGFTQVANIEGGIEAWSQQVDSDIPRY